MLIPFEEPWGGGGGVESVGLICLLAFMWMGAVSLLRTWSNCRTRVALGWHFTRDSMALFMALHWVLCLALYMVLCMALFMTLYMVFCMALCWVLFSWHFTGHFVWHAPGFKHAIVSFVPSTSHTVHAFASRRVNIQTNKRWGRQMLTTH